MSFSSKVKEELYRHVSTARHCQLAELAAILHFCGSIGSGKEGTFLQIRAENALVVRKSFTLLQKTFNISTETKVQREEMFAGRSKGGSISGGIGRPMMVNTEDATLPM